MCTGSQEGQPGIGYAEKIIQVQGCEHLAASVQGNSEVETGVLQHSVETYNTKGQGYSREGAKASHELHPWTEGPHL